jgi:aspartate/methionine/tyrosine aminotransferase
MESRQAGLSTLAERVSRLGTETAFVAAAEAAVAAAAGQKVYPFHLGDLNLATPENITEAAFRAISERKTGYCPNGGIPELRDAIATDVGGARGVRYGPENVSVQPGGKPVIGKFLLALMNAGDEVLFPNPGFPIYESFIQFLGGVAVPYAYEERPDGFGFDVGALERAVGSRTRLLILNDMHNPTGGECSTGELERLAELILERNLLVLCDEAYFDVRYQGESRSLASLPGMAERCVILHTFSKKFAMTGWRLGAAVGPKSIIDVITTLNVNCESCTNHFVQWAGVEALTGDQEAPRRILRVLKQRRDVAARCLNAIDGVHCRVPNVTFYLYPDVAEAMARKGFTDYEVFRRAVLAETGVSMCSRTHFGHELPGERGRHLRFAYSGIEADQIEEGLDKLRVFLES